MNLPIEFICDNISANDKGHLCFAGQDTVSLAERFGTPLYLLDEARVRHNVRVYKSAFEKHFGARAQVVYASKALSMKRMYGIMTEEGTCVDCVSCGELYTARAAGYDMANVYFHGNNKTDEDVAYAMDAGVGSFVVDNVEEIDVIEREAAKRGIRQKLLLRLTPGIDTHTYAAVKTGLVDSKFGTAIETGQAREIALYTLKQPHIELEGFHCHVGSQVFAEDVFERSCVIMLEFIAAFRAETGYMPEKLDLGGGYGVRYKADDPYLDIEREIAVVAQTMKDSCARLDLPEPVILMEPGRSIVADAGMTLYTAGTVKRIPGYKNYVSVDGGMSDNPRFALYGSNYTAYAANKLDHPHDFICSLVGRCCESGDVIQPSVPFPRDIERGDIVAVCTTGAYNYAMASNYNRIPRPSIVVLKDGEAEIAVRRETLDDIVRLDV